MHLSIHPRPYDIQQARTQRDYARHFAAGWRQIEVKRASLFSEILTTSVWSPARMNGGRRCLAAFAGTQLLALDFENPEYSLEQAMREWCDTIHWIGTTRNHQREKGGICCDRFRLVVPWAEDITDPDIYNYNYACVAEAYGADTQVKDVARLFFPCQEVVSVNLEGERQPVKPLPVAWIERRERWAQRKTTNVRIGFIPLYIRRKLEIQIPAGTRNTTWYGFAKDLASYGFEEERLVEMILGSETYKGDVVSPSLIREIQGCVRRGLKDGRQELSPS